LSQGQPVNNFLRTKPVTPSFAIPLTLNTSPAADSGKFRDTEAKVVRSGRQDLAAVKAHAFPNYLSDGPVLLSFSTRASAIHPKFAKCLIG
jgi:hypothetical protein